MDGVELELTKRRHREIVGILITARGRPVSTSALVDELWEFTPPTGAVGAVRTFIAELRRILEPKRPARTRPSVLVTVDNGYALRLDRASVDAWRVEDAVDASRALPPGEADQQLSMALAEWRGNAYGEFAERPWARDERARLAELHSRVVELVADARLSSGRAQEVIPILDTHVVAHPWREEGWRLLGLALYRSGRPADALEVLRRARHRLADDLGLDPAPALTELESNILRRQPSLELVDPGGLSDTVAAYARTGIRAQLEAANALLGSLAVSGDLEVVRVQRLAAIAAAEEMGDPELTARVIGGFDVPGIWTRSDDPAAAAAVVAAAERALTFPSGQLSIRTRARLLGTIAMETRGTANRLAEAREAEELARLSGDPHLLCFALNARFMQMFWRTGLARQRSLLGQELITAAQAAESATFEISGRLIRMQAQCALGDITAAATEALAVDQLARTHERPLATVFTRWFRSTFTDTEEGDPPLSSEMHGFTVGLKALASLTGQLRNGTPLSDGDFGPYEPWVRPLLLVRAGKHQQALDDLQVLPDPAHDLLLEALWCIVGQAAYELENVGMMRRAHLALEPARSERAAGSGVIDLGSVDHFLRRLEVQ